MPSLPDYAPTLSGVEGALGRGRYMRAEDRWWNFFVVLTELTRARLGLPATVHAFRLDTLVCRVCGRTAQAIFEDAPHESRPAH